MTKLEGRYRIQAVAEMTGVPAATLRAWERRYGLPLPARAASAYRLYNDADIAMVRRVRDMCAQGMAPAEAARLVLSAQNDQSQPRPDRDPYGVYRERILAAVASYDGQALEDEARATLLLGSAVSIFDRIVVPVMREVGRRWEQGQLSIAQEHLASEVLGGLARDLLRVAQPGEGARRVLLACFPDEMHGLPLYVVGLRLTQLGYRAVVLGPRTPTAEIARAVKEVAPDLVALSLSTTLPVEHLDVYLREYAAACGEVPFIVGGLGAEEHAARVEAAGGVMAPDAVSELGAVLGRVVRG